MGRTAQHAVLRPLLRVGLVMAILMTTLTVTGLRPAAAAEPGLTLKKSTPATVLFGGTSAVNLAAVNSGDTELYNLSYRDVLPAGVTYQSGSSLLVGEPARSLPDPEVIWVEDDDPTTDDRHQVLLWHNVADLTTGSQQEIRFTVAVDAEVWKIGEQFENAADGWASTDEREVPAFDDDGEPDPSDTVVGDDDTATTTVSAIQLSKSEASPEGELLRGVGDHQTTYSLTVTNNSQGTTGDLVVVDYLPAGLEFLGCGGEFNSDAEYSGGSTEVTPVDDCLEPESVTTVSDPEGLSGVFTKVVWRLSGELGPDHSRTIRYAAGIPQRENQLFAEESAPSPESGEQAANLDNNTGPSTREQTTESSLVNHANVSGSFTSDDGEFTDLAVLDSTTHSVTAEDLRLVKTADRQDFIQGELVTYTLTIDASEYADISDLEITDTMPAGLCIIDDDPEANLTALTGCEGQSGAAPQGAEITSVVAQPDGSYRVTLFPDETGLSANGQLIVRYTALMRTTFDTDPDNLTSAADQFTNSASVSGTSTIRDEVDPPATDTEAVTVSDTSEVTLVSSTPTIRKLRMPNTTPMSCSTDIADYSVSADETDDDEAAFDIGDRVCFWLQVSFPAGVDTRNAQLTDFLPANLSLESTTVQEGSAPVLSETVSGGTIRWRIGEAIGGSQWAAERGSVFNVVVAATATTAPTASLTNPRATITDNLAKFRYTNSANKSQSLRDSVAVPLAPPPPIGLEKGVGSSLSDGVQVIAADTADFVVRVTNLAEDGAVNDRTIVDPVVWDVLPAGTSCNEVSVISDNGFCYDAGSADRPVLSSGDTTSSVIVWRLTGVSLAAGQSMDLSYTFTVPDPISVSRVLNNTAAVVSYGTLTNKGEASTVTHYPQDNLSTVAEADQLVPRAEDDSSLVVPDAVVDKTVTTAVSESGNNAASQATIGEDLTYTITVTIPAGTTAYHGVLSDQLPSGVELAGTPTATLNGGALPDGVSVTANGGLDLGDSYTATTDAVFTLVVPARVTTAESNVRGVSLTNTASFNSDTALVGGSAIPARTDQATVTVVEPLPSITKTASGSTFVGGTVIPYVLTAANQQARSVLHDAVVVDCLPAGLTFDGFTAGYPAGTTTAGDPAANGCAVGATAITWNLGSLNPGASVALRFTAVVSGIPAAGTSFANNATITGRSLSSGNVASSLTRSYWSAATATVTVTGATITKTAVKSTLAPGERGQWTMKVTLPAKVQFYDTIITDSMPDGFDLPGLTIDSVSCTGTWTSCPTAQTLTRLTASGTGSRTIGWLLGDVAAANDQRTLTITYSATLRADHSGNTASTKRSNRAYVKWNTVKAVTPPTSSGATMNKSAQSSQVDIWVTEPSIVMAKTVDDTTPDPEQTLTYTVSASNTGRSSYASTAYNLVVVDTVPVGINVITDTISNGGVWNPNGRTITWTVTDPLVAGTGTVSFSYRAKVAPSSELTGAALTNSVRATNYESLASGGRVYTAGPVTASVTPQFPAVSVAKAVSSAVSYVNESTGWTITLTNTGGADARNVTITDQLPKNWVYDTGSATVSVAGGMADPTITLVDGSQTLVWDTDLTVPAHGVLNVSYTATPQTGALSDPGTGSTAAHQNRATAVVEDITGATANQTGSYSPGSGTASSYLHSADLSLTKTSSATDHQVPAGSSLSWTITVTNLGSNPAVGPITVTDTLPDTDVLTGYQVDNTSRGWDCSIDAGTTLTCTRSGPLAAGATAPVITLSAAVRSDADADVALTNSATVTARTYDPDSTNNSATVTDHTARVVDITIDKAAPEEAIAGTDLSYTLTVSNGGPSDGQTGMFTVRDELPEGATFVSATSRGDIWDCSEADSVVTCTTTDALAATTSLVPITIRVTLARDLSGELSNTATVTGPEPSLDPETANNTDTAATTVNAQADLGLTKVHSTGDGDWVAGGTGEYTFTVTNYGPSDAADPVVTDMLPDSLTFVEITAGGADWSCSGSRPMVCERTSPLSAESALATDSFTVKVKVAGSQVGDITNTASVSTETDDPNPENDEATDVTGSLRRADLGIVKEGPVTVIAGNSITYTLTVTNYGESDYLAGELIYVIDVMPSNVLSQVVANGTGWTCSGSEVVTCSYPGGLASGETAPVITITALTDASALGQALVNQAFVSGALVDSGVHPNDTIHGAVLTTKADLELTKTADSASVNAGAEVEYQLKVKNKGPSVARTVSLTDPLTAGLSLIDIDAPAGWTCEDGLVVSCTTASMDPDTTATITVTAKVGAGVTVGSLTNTATVSSPTDRAGRSPTMRRSRSPSERIFR